MVSLEHGTGRTKAGARIARRVGRDGKALSRTCGTRFEHRSSLAGAGTRGRDSACDGFRTGCGSNGTPRSPGGGCVPATVRHHAGIVLPTVAAARANSRAPNIVALEA